MGFLGQSFLEVHTLTTTDQKAFKGTLKQKYHILEMYYKYACFLVSSCQDMDHLFPVGFVDSLTSKRMVMRTEQSTKCLYHISYGG